MAMELPPASTFTPTMPAYGGNPMGGGVASSALLAALASTPGLGQLLLPLIASFGPSILSKIFNKGQDVNAQIRELLKPGTLQKLQAQFYQQGLQSPGFAQAQSSIATGANVASNQIGQSLAARGLGTTGTGAVLSGLTPSLIGSQKSQLYTDIHNASMSAAQQNVAERVRALQSQQPGQAQQLLGAGVESFSPYLASFLKARYPSSFGNLTTPGQQRYA